MDKFSYKSLSSSDERYGSLDSDEEETKGFLNDTRRRSHQYKYGASRTLVFLTILNVCIFFLACALVGISFSHRLDFNSDYRRVSAYSPIMDKFRLESTIRKINGTFYPSKDGGSIARQQPNPKDDAIWDEWELTRVYPATREEIIKMGTDPTTVAKLEDDVWGLGDDAFATIFDVYHQVHCLNSLRHIAYGEYYNKSMARAHTVKQREIHLNHCIDILLQSIKCNANLDLIPLHWVETQEYPFPDMSINKKCVNFDGLTEWRKDHTIDMKKYVEVMKMPEGEKPGVQQHPAADQYYDYFGYENPNHVDKTKGGHGLPLDVDSNL